MQETHSSFSPLPFTAAAAAMNTMNGGVEEEEEEDHFDRLPDAIIIEIFGKVPHAKYLIRCFSVCKRFASLLPQTHTAFISIRFRKKQNPISAIFKNIVNIPLRIFHMIRMAPALSSSSSSSSHTTDYHAPPCSWSCIVKFSGVRSLRIEFVHASLASSNCCIHDTWMRYKAVIGARFEVAVFFSTFGDYRKEQDFNDIGMLPDVVEAVEESFLKLIKGGLESALGNHNLAQSLIKSLPSLSELVIANKRIGKLCMGKEQIVELRRTNLGTTISGSGVKSELSSSEVIGCNGGVGVQFWHTAMVLESPSSASVMKWAMVAVVNPEDEEIVMGRDIGLILGAFEGGDEDDDDDEYGKVIDEVVNTVREGIIADQDEPSSFMTHHRLQLIED